VRSKLKRDRRVNAVKFISRKVALRKLLKQHPRYKGTLPSNPLPDSLLVTTSAPRAVAASLRPLPPGVQAVKVGARF
jgi:cell division protein FtsX